MATQTLTRFSAKSPRVSHGQSNYFISIDSIAGIAAHEIKLTLDDVKFQEKLRHLTAEVDALKKKVASMEANFEIIDLRDIPRAQAKDEIRAFFQEHKGEEIYPSDIMAALCLDYELISEICHELEQDGKIKEL